MFLLAASRHQEQQQKASAFAGWLGSNADQKGITKYMEDSRIDGKIKVDRRVSPEMAQQEMLRLQSFLSAK